MNNIFGLIKGMLGADMIKIHFPCTFYFMSERMVIFTQHQDAGYVKISLDYYDNKSSIEPAIYSMETQGAPSRMKEVIRKYFARENVVVPEAASVDDLILLAMEIYYFYQYMVVLPDDQESEASREEFFETLSEEEKQKHGGVFEKDDFDTLFNEAHEAYRYLQSLRAKTPRDALDLINADLFFRM